jgi:hypothetical protein
MLSLKCPIWLSILARLGFYISRQQFHSQFNQVNYIPTSPMTTDTIYKLKIVIPKMKSQDFISSLWWLVYPFSRNANRGTFDYKLDFKFNKTNPTNSFLTAIWERKFKNNKIWRSESNQTNGEFVYRAIIKSTTAPGFSRAIKSNYTPINQISPYLRKCVLTTEDPSSLPSRIYKWSVQAIYCQKHKTKKFSRRQYHQHAIDKKRFPNPRENSISKMRKFCWFTF